MKNNVIVILLVVLIGVLSGVGLLFGIGNAVQVATYPLVEKLSEVAAGQKSIETKLNVLDAKLTSLNAQVSSRLAANGGAQPQQPQRPQPPAEDYNKVYPIPVGNSIIVGKKDAPVTIQEFTDLQCPFCARFHPVINEALKAYPDKVNLLIKNFPLPFHPNAKPAAKLTLAAAEQGKYYEMVEILLENGADVTEAKVKEYAQKLGLNYDKLLAAGKANDAKYEQQIADDMALANQVEVRGTPTFFINGKKTMARDLAGFKAEIDKILAAKK